MNKLNGQRFYLVGTMDRIPDRGTEWRQDITPALQDMGIMTFDPTNKPTSLGNETKETIKEVNDFKKCGDFDKASEAMKPIRQADLRMVDICDAIIVRLSLEQFPCGTWEEIFMANSQRKPVLLWMVEGKHCVPNWLFGVLPHEFFFSSQENLLNYLYKVNSGRAVSDRWVFFDNVRNEKFEEYKEISMLLSYQIDLMFKALDIEDLNVDKLEYEIKRVANYRDSIIKYPECRREAYKIHSLFTRIFG